MTILHNEKLMDEAKQRHTKKVSAWEENFREIADSLINDEKVTKADNVKMSVERISILPCFQEQIRAFQFLFNASVERKVVLTEIMVRIWDQLDSGRWIGRSDYSPKIFELEPEGKWLSGMVELDELELQIMAGLMDNSHRLREEISNLKEERDHLTASNKVVLVPGTEIYELISTTGTIVGALQDLKAPSNGTESDLKMA